MSTNDKPLILVADDEPSTLALVSNHLRGRGYRVIEAADGDEAWDLACRELPDLVVLDVMMPGMSGWEVCRKIRDAVSLAHTGVVMLTGIGDTLNELTSPLYGADAYLDKPFQFTKLQELVEDTLKSRKGGNLGRPERTTGPATRLWKTSISDAPPAEDAPVRTRKAKTAPSAAEKNDVEPAVARLLPGKPPVKAKAAPVAARR
jgi:DNA-binding response OmpR family regulator